MDCVPVYVLTIFAPLDLLPKVYSSAVVGLGDSSLHNVHVCSTIYNNAYSKDFFKIQCFIPKPFLTCIGNSGYEAYVTL